MIIKNVVNNFINFFLRCKYQWDRCGQLCSSVLHPVVTRILSVLFQTPSWITEAVMEKGRRGGGGCHIEYCWGGFFFFPSPTLNAVELLYISREASSVPRCDGGSLGNKIATKSPPKSCLSGVREHLWSNTFFHFLISVSSRKKASAAGVHHTSVTEDQTFTKIDIRKRFASSPSVLFFFMINWYKLMLHLLIYNIKRHDSVFTIR